MVTITYLYFPIARFHETYIKEWILYIQEINLIIYISFKWLAN